MIKFRAALLAASLFVVPQIADAATISLAEALGVAYETNPQLGAQQANLRATDEEVAKANSGWRPSINAQGSWGPQQARWAPASRRAGACKAGRGASGPHSR